MKYNRVRGFTFIEILLVIGILALLVPILVIGAQGISSAQRASATWTVGRFTSAPSIVDISPTTVTFTFAMKSGTGIDVNNQPVNYNAGTAVTGRSATVSLWRPSPINGQIVSLNGIGLGSGAVSGMTTTDPNGVIAIEVEIDDETSFRLQVVTSNGTETHIFVGDDL